MDHGVDFSIDQPPCPCCLQ